VSLARRFLQELVPLLETVWVDRELHAAAVAAYASRRRASLVDSVSFELMRRRGIEQALALDEDFVREGFALVPLH
jgi:predicted nucleic acid-binding protein